MDSFWRTKAASLPERRLRWPAPLNILTQLVIATLVGGVWGGLFFGFLALTRDEPEPLPASSPAAESAAGPPP
nr:hypothetical protein [Anaerolineae bacterium]